MIETECPNYGSVIIIPSSCKMYECVCGKQYKIIIRKDETSRTVTTRVRNTPECEETFGDFVQRR
jgi:hypothetical protein